MRATNFLKTTRTYDLIEIVPDSPAKAPTTQDQYLLQRCTCGAIRDAHERDVTEDDQPFFGFCAATHCEEFDEDDSDAPCAICRYQECKCGSEYLNVDSTASLGLESR